MGQPEDTFGTRRRVGVEVSQGRIWGGVVHDFECTPVSAYDARVKYAIVIPSGGADRPTDALDGLTALAAATTPAMDRVSMTGRQGTARTIPSDQLSDSAGGLCGLLGIAEPPSDGQLRASAAGITLKPDDLALRLDLVSTSNPDEDPSRRSILLAHHPAELSTAEARVLLNDLIEHWKQSLPDHHAMLERITVHVGSRGAHLLVDHGGQLATALDEAPLLTSQPEAIIGHPWQDAAPEGAAGQLVAILMETSHACFANHEINRTRTEAGLLPVSMAWISGVPLTGPSRLKRFEDAHGIKAAMVSRSPHALGLAGILGIDRISLPEAETLTERISTLGEYARTTLDRYDLVIVETSAPAEASLDGDIHAKIQTLELIDRAVITPLVARLEEEGNNEQNPEDTGFRCMVACDRVISTDDRLPTSDAAPFAMCGSWVRSVIQGPFTETEAQGSDLHIERASDLMEYFLFSGLKRPRSTRRPRRTPSPTPTES
jgi:2,3-bisphosphoglycerate-independent phosphoglycerate mutase